MRLKFLCFLAIGATALTGCDLGVQGGSSALEAHFSGISSATVISPSAVQLQWGLSQAYTGYDVYVSTQDAPLASNVIFGSYTVTGLSPGTNYFFSVSGLSSDGSQDGLSKEISAQTWSTFTGPTSATTLDANDIALAWDYQNGPTYEVYYKAAAAGSAAPTFSLSDLQGSPNITSQSATGMTVGGLLPNSIYSFAVVAKYSDGTSSISKGQSSTASSVTALVTSQGNLLTMPTLTTSQTVTAGSRPSFTASMGAQSFVSTVFTGSLTNASSCPSVPAGQAVATISGNGTASATIALSAGTYTFSVQVKDTGTGFCGYETFPVVTAQAASLGGGIITVSATTPSGISPLPIVTANPVQLGSFPTFTVSGAMAGYETQILYNGTPVASLMGNGTMQTLGSNPFPRGQAQVTPVVSYGGQTATLSPITVTIKGFDSLPVSGPSFFNGTPASSPAFGESAIVGDFNCDGYPDIAIGAPLGLFGTPGGLNGYSELPAGGVAVYYGTASGLDFSTTPSFSPSGTKPLFIPSPNALTSGTGTSAWGGVYFGEWLASGQINGTSVSGKPCSDLIVSSAGDAGLYVYYGSQNGLQVTSPYSTNSLACNSAGDCQTSKMSLYGTPDYPGTNMQFQLNVASGDFNGDGYDDVALAVTWAQDSQVTTAWPNFTGAIFLYYGSSYGLSPTYTKFYAPAGLVNSYTNLGKGLAFGNVQYKSAGVCSTGKCKDLVASMDSTATNGPSGVLVVTGNSSGISVDSFSQLSSGYFSLFPAQCASGGTASYCGSPLITTDINQDGYDDIIFGSYNLKPPAPYNAPTGGVFVFYGNPSGTPSGATTGTSTTVMTTGTPCTTSRNGSSCSPQVIYRTVDQITGMQFSYSLANLGDTNGDGYPEIAIGSPGYNGSGRGAAYVYNGSAYGLVGSNVVNITSAPNSYMGTSVAGASFNLPTFSSQFPSTPAASPLPAGQFHDLVVGAAGASLTSTGNNGQGVAYFFKNDGVNLNGVTSPTSEFPSISSLEVATGMRGDLAKFVGDINGDGFGDVILPIHYAGTPNFDTSASTGSNYIAQGFQRIEYTSRWGFAVYYGSSNGLITTPAPTYAPLNPTDPLLVTDVQYGSIDFALGLNLTGGDFNGDGFVDVASSSFSNTMIFYGSSTGLLASVTPLQTPNSVMDPLRITWGMGDNFASNGSSAQTPAPQLLTTGDFNGDGYQDLVLAQGTGTSTGCNNPGNGSWVYVLYGSQNGLVSGGKLVAPNGTPDTNPENNSSWTPNTLSGNWPSAQMGPLAMYTCDQSLYGTCNITAPVAVPFAMGKTNWGNGCSLATYTGPARIVSVGDIDHDGTDDLVMVDERDSNYAGAIFIFYGNETNGLQTDQYARLRIPPLYGSGYPTSYVPVGNARDLGRNEWGSLVPGGALSRAYDVNGDGVGDFVVGAREETSGSSTQYTGGGTAYLVYGINGGWKSLGSGICVPDPHNTSGSGYPCTVTLSNVGAADQIPYHVVTNADNSCNPSTNTCNVLRFYPNQYAATGASFGEGVLGLKDITGDGFADIAVTQNKGGTYQTQLFIFSGSVNGLLVSSVPTVTPNCSSGACSPYLTTVTNDPTAARQGISSNFMVNGWSSSDDVDKDGYADFGASSVYVSDPSGAGYWNGGFYLFH